MLLKRFLLTKTNIGNLMDFIWTTVLDALAYRAHRLKLALIGQLNNSLTRRKYIMKADMLYKM